MKKRYLILSVILCVVFLFNNIAAFADDENDGILTLEEAKALALKNDVQFNLQESYIAQAKEDYKEVLEDSSGNANGKNSSVAAKAAAKISQDVAIENAAFSVQKAILNKDSMIRESDYDVTTNFYGVIKAQYSLVEAEADIKLKKSALEAARIKYGLSIITKNSLSQAEITYASSQTAYNKALSELQNSMSKLCNSIGIDMNVFKDQLDLTLSVADIKSIELSKIKEDNLKNNSTYYTAKEQYKLAEHKLSRTQELYEDYYEKFKGNSAVRDDFEDMLYDAQKDFDNVQYSYNEKLYDLNITLSNQFTSINNLYERYINQKEEFEDAKVTNEESRIKYQMGVLSKSALDNSLASLKKLENQLNTTIMNLNTQYLNMTQYSLNQ